MSDHGKIIILKISDIAFGGSGVGRCEGKVIFVPGVLPGETVKIEVTSERKNFSLGRLIEIMEKSEDRIEPCCPLAVRASGKNKKSLFCPGCSYQHISYERELDLKRQQFEGFIAKACREICPLPEFSAPIPSPENLNYRNKITLRVSSEKSIFKLGYLMEDNETVIDIPQCPLARDEINRLLSEKRSEVTFKGRLQDSAKIVFRHTAFDGVLCWDAKKTPAGKLLREETMLGTLNVPQGGFFQINPPCMNKLISVVQDIIDERKPESVIDLYCGVGIFSLAAAMKKVPSVTGIDCDKSSVDTAALNARNLGLSCCFMSGDAGRLAEGEFRKATPEKTLLILDPPRTGIDKRLLILIENIKIKSIIYISCGPDTLGRDLRSMLSCGYRIRKTGLIDMFPRTYHFESLTYLERD